METLPLLVVAFLAIFALIMSSFLRRLVGVIFQVILFTIGIAVTVAGVTMLMNEETVFDKPGAKLRTVRFLTMNSARTSATGDASLTCDLNSPAPSAEPSPAPAEKKHRKKDAQSAGIEASPSAIATPAGATALEEENAYDELMTRSYPGIPRDRLFALSKEVINQMGGWKIVSEDPRSGTIDCVYTSRIIAMQDDVRITINSKSEVDVCSRSGTLRPGSTSLMRYFPGDLAANVGHIKQFYEALEPRTDQTYQQQQDKATPTKPH